MKKLIIAITMCISLSLFAGGEWKDLKKAEKLAQEGKYKEALKEHLMFYEDSKKVVGMGGVRLSYAIKDWVKLSKKYPPALTALLEVRDKNKKALLDGTGNFQNFHDLSSINQYLNKDNETYELFLEIDKKFPTLATSCFIVTKDLVVEHKNYQLYGKYLKDPIGKYEEIVSMREMNLSGMRTNPKLNNESMKKFSDDSFIKDTCQLIEVLVGLNRKKEAEEIQKRALKYFDNPKIKTAITDAEAKIKEKK